MGKKQTVEKKIFYILRENISTVYSIYCTNEDFFFVEFPLPTPTKKSLLKSNFNFA